MAFEVYGGWIFAETPSLRESWIESRGKPPSFGLDVLEHNARERSQVARRKALLGGTREGFP